ncbi:MAG: ECF-type sigma factor [Planctomycetota bacterium]|nr:ECF-type sigma factor [Planctomycetota bacterium]MDA1251380.1 ECF-type sigma factor [Planctomycetota bacterium]
MDSLWAEFTPILEQLAEEWLSKSLQRAELDQVADSSPVKSLHLQLKNGELRFRGSDELWRLVAAVALSRLPDSEIESSMKFASQMVQVIRPLLDELADADLESAALLKLTGSTNDEIARHMSCTRRTVQRLLKLIRDICESQIKP